MQVELPVYGVTVFYDSLLQLQFSANVQYISNLPCLTGKKYIDVDMRTDEDICFCLFGIAYIILLGAA